MSADRFQQAAKANDSGSWNKYSYTRGDPVNRADRHGTEDWCIDETDCEDPCDGNSFLAGCDGDPGGGGPGPTCQYGTNPDGTCASAPGPQSCSLNFEHHNVDRLVGIGVLGAGHGYLDVTTAVGSYVVEGFDAGGPLNANQSGNGTPNDRPGADPSYGTITGSFVCDWLGTLSSGVSTINKDNVTYNKTGPNSNTALYYLLSLLPATTSAWFSGVNLIGFYYYNF